MSSQCETTGKRAGGAPMGFFERYLTLWVFICILIGIGLGHLAPGAFHAVAAIEIAQINLPVAVLIWLMIIPMLLKIDLKALKGVTEHWRGVGVTLFINWAVKPFSMALLAWLFIGGLFRPWLPADLAHGAEVDLQQHRDDHQPDQDRHRQVDLGHLHRAERGEGAGEQVAQRGADHDARDDPQGQMALEWPHALRQLDRRRARDVVLHARAALPVVLRAAFVAAGKQAAAFPPQQLLVRNSIRLFMTSKLAR